MKTMIAAKEWHGKVSDTFGYPYGGITYRNATHQKFGRFFNMLDMNFKYAEHGKMFPRMSYARFHVEGVYLSILNNVPGSDELSRYRRMHNENESDPFIVIWGTPENYNGIAFFTYVENVGELQTITLREGKWCDDKGGELFLRRGQHTSSSFFGRRKNGVPGISICERTDITVVGELGSPPNFVRCTVPRLTECVIPDLVTVEAGLASNRRLWP